MYYMPKLRVRKVGNSLGVILPKQLVAKHKVKLNDEVTVTFDEPPTLESVFGSIRHLGLTPDELNDLTNEGEEL